MTHALFKTQAFNLQTMLTKTYRDQGFIVRYAVSYDDAYSKIKGAFTSCMSGFFDSVCQLDFSSHYPSVMYQWSLSPENLSEDGPIVVDLHDETTPITYRWNQAHGILDSKINEIYHQRL